jgi:hypothetical protein
MRMEMRRALLAGFAAAALAVPAAARAEVVSAFGVTLQSCVVNQQGDLTNGIQVVFSNTHASPATEVDFMVHYHKHHALFVDRGTFAQGEQISHDLTGALVGRSWQGAQPHLCEVHRVVLANGKILQ